MLPAALLDIFARPFSWGVWSARTAEHALQAARVQGRDLEDTRQWVTKILAAPTVQSARVLAAAAPQRADWSEVREVVRRSVLAAKFRDLEMAAGLAAAAEEELDEDLRWLRAHWGMQPTLLPPSDLLPPLPPCVQAPELLPLAESILPDGHEDDSLRRERARLLDQMRTGTSCRACGQRVQIYRRTLQSTIARDLIRIHRVWVARGGPAGLQSGFPVWVAVDAVPGVRGGDYGKARFWKLVEQRSKSDRVARGEIRTSGEWTFTQLGHDFILGKADVRKAVWVYGNEVAPGPWEREDDLIPTSIRQALGRRFNYEQLIAGAVVT